MTLWNTAGEGAVVLAAGGVQGAGEAEHADREVVLGHRLRAALLVGAEDVGHLQPLVGGGGGGGAGADGRQSAGGGHCCDHDLLKLLAHGTLGSSLVRRD
jgi:hypothetical protein